MAKKRSGPDLAARFAKIGDAIETEAEKALFEIGVKVRDGAERNVNSQAGPGKNGRKRKRTGKLAKSYTVKMRHRGTTPVAVVGTSDPKATYYEFAKDISGHAYKPETDTPRALYKSLDDNVDDVAQMVADAIGRGLGRVEGA